MPHRYEEPAEHEFDLAPEVVWDAIATGPGLTSWFMGTTEVEPERGVVRTTMGGYVQESTIVDYEPNRHFSFRGAESPDGRFFAMEFLIEGRDSGGTVLRIVGSGFLPGDDWEDEFEAMLEGSAVYRQTLVGYLEHFAGRRGIAVTASAPFGELDRRWQAMRADLGVTGREAVGDVVLLRPAGLGPLEGVVDVATASTLGVRTEDGLYRFFRGFYAAGVGHHLFGEADAAAPTHAWQSWLDAVAGGASHG